MIPPPDLIMIIKGIAPRALTATQTCPTLAENKILSTMPSSRRKALIVGINTYAVPEGYKGKDPCLKACVNDAKQMDQILSRHYDQTPNFETKVLQTEQRHVNHSLLMESIEELLTSDKDTNMALFYFSGHGTVVDGELMLCPTDYMTHRKGIALSWVMDLITSSDIKEIVLILDCCYSGAAADTPDEPIAIAEIRKGVTILAASHRDEVSMERLGQGKFTHFLLRGLRGSAKDAFGDVTPLSLYAFTASFFKLWEQNPILKTYTDEPTSLRQCKPELAEKHLRRIVELFPQPNHEVDLENPTCSDLKTLKKLARFGYVVGQHGKSIKQEAKYDGKCSLTEAGKDLHELIRKQKK